MSWKTAAARNLRDVFSSLQDWAFDVAERLDPILPPETEQERDAKASAMLAHVRLRLDHPCRECRGEGYVTVSAGTDSAICPRCRGGYIDPDYLAAGARS